MSRKRPSKSSPLSQNTVFDIHSRGGSGWDRPRETVSLRQHLYRRHPVLTSAGAFALILVAVLTADTFLGHANTVYWYPKSCLGGWTNPANAAGAPELLPIATTTEFTADNSAILDNSLSQIFCGEFGGNLPPQTLPVSVTLNMSLAFKTVPGPVGLAQSDPLVAGASTSTEADTITTSTPPADEGSSTGEAPALEPVVDTTLEQQPNAPVAEPEPVSAPEPIPSPTEDSPATFLFGPARVAFAQEASADPEFSEPEAPASDIPEPEPAPPDPAVIDDSAAGEAASSEPAQDDPIANDASTTETTAGGEVLGVVSTTENASDTTASADGLDATSSADTIPDPKNVLEVSYSIDGQNWQSLGMVGESNWQNAHFSVPIASWKDLEKLQISIASLPVSDIAPIVYLDGMSLAVDYGPGPEVIPTHFDLASSTTAGPIRLAVGDDGNGTEILNVRGDVSSNLFFYDLNDPRFLISVSIGNQVLVMPVYNFQVGDFAVVSTADPDSCDGESVDMCRNGNGYLGESRFSVR
jgi:hypothetical protein